MYSIWLLTVSSVYRIHLLNIQDGSPHCSSPSNVITWTIPQGMPPIECADLTMTASRIMWYVVHDAFRWDMTWYTAVVWDRKTGDLVRTLQPQSGRIS